MIPISSTVRKDSSQTSGSLEYSEDINEEGEEQAYVGPESVESSPQYRSSTSVDSMVGNADDLFSLASVPGSVTLSPRSSSKSPPPYESGLTEPPPVGLLATIWRSQLTLWTFVLSTSLILLYRRRLRPDALFVTFVTVWLALFASVAIIMILVLCHVFKIGLRIWGLLSRPLRWVGLVGSNGYLGGQRLVFNLTRAQSWAAASQVPRRSVTPTSLQSSPMPGRGAFNYVGGLRRLSSMPDSWAQAASMENGPILWQGPASNDQQFYGSVCTRN